ncbi:MAG: hypothetical protein J6S67_05210 [Methanobrevibacter sp.]|nr:hypothetical protein [Methanobrevibacter sp.]
MQNYVRNQIKLTKEAYVINANATQVIPYDGFIRTEITGSWDGKTSGILIITINNVAIANFHYVNTFTYPNIRQYIPVRKGDTIQVLKAENPAQARTIEALWYKQRDYATD